MTRSRCGYSRLLTDALARSLPRSLPLPHTATAVTKTFPTRLPWQHTSFLCIGFALRFYARLRSLPLFPLPGYLPAAFALPTPATAHCDGCDYRSCGGARCTSRFDLPRDIHALSVRICADAGHWRITAARTHTTRATRITRHTPSACCLRFAHHYYVYHCVCARYERKKRRWTFGLPLVPHAPPFLPPRSPRSTLTTPPHTGCVTRFIISPCLVLPPCLCLPHGYLVCFVRFSLRMAPHRATVLRCLVPALRCT